MPSTFQIILLCFITETHAHIQFSQYCGKYAGKETAVARERLSTLPLLGGGCANTQKTPEQSLGNGHTRTKEGTVGSDVFCAVRAEAI
jgi:hypothetical protein